MKSTSLFAPSLFAALVACGGGNAAEPQAAGPRAPVADASSSMTFATAPAPGSSSAPAASAAPGLSADALSALVGASDRTGDDRKLDANRHPDQFLAFVGVGSGMRVADLGAGGGY